MTEQPKIEKRLPKRKILKKVAIITSALVVLGILLPLAYLDTAAGHKTLVAWANERLAVEDSGIKLGKLEGSLYSDFGFADIIVSDPNGVWLKLHQVNINWSPLKLVWGTLQVSEMHAKTAQLYRLPYKGETTKAATSDTWAMPTMPFDVDVKSFEVAEIDVAKNLVGKRASFVSRGALEINRVKGTFLKATLVNTGKTADEIFVQIDYPKNKNTLSVNANISAPRGGAIGAFIGISPDYDIQAHLEGSGPTGNWAGQFTAQINDTEIARASLRVKDKALALRANLEAGDFVQDETVTLFGKSATLSLDVQPTEDISIADFSASLSAETLKFNATGQLSPIDMKIINRVEYSAEILETQQLNKMLQPLRLEPFELTGYVSGDITAPKITTIFSDMLVAHETGVGMKAGGQIETTLLGGSISIQTTGTLENIAGKTLAQSIPDSVVAVAGPGLDWQLSGSINSASNQINLINAVLQNSNIKLSGNGKANMTFEAFEGEISALLSNSGLLLFSSKGELLADMSVRRLAGDARTQANVSIVGEKLELPDKTLSDLLGGSPTLEISAVLNSDGSLAIPAVDLMSKHVVLKGDAAVSPDLRFESSKFGLTLSELNTVRSLENLSFAGTLSVDGVLRGWVTNPSIVLNTNLQQLDIQRIKLHDMGAELSVRNLFSAPNGRLELTSETDFGPLIAEADFLFEQSGAYQVSDLKAVFAESYHAEGGIQAAAGKPAVGSVKIRTDAQEPTYGTISGELLFEGKGQKQGLTLKGTAVTIKAVLEDGEVLSLEEGDVISSVVFANDQPLIDLTLSLTGFSHPAIQMSSATVVAKQHGKEIDYDINLRGTNLTPYGMALSGKAFASNEDGLNLSMAAMGSLGKTIVKTKEPMVALVHNGDFTLLPFVLELGEGFFAGSLSSTEDELKVSLSARNADIAPAIMFYPNIPLTGILSGDVEMRAVKEGADGGFNLNLSSISAGADATVLDDRMGVAITGKLSGGHLGFSGKIGMGDVLSAEFQGDLPVVVDAKMKRLSIEREKAVRGEVHWQGDVWPVWPVLNLVNHDLTGMAETHLTVGGTLNEPELSGRLGLKKGRYENMQTGFVAAGIEMDASVEGEQLLLERFTATDGADGSVIADGKVILESDFDFIAEGSLVLDKAIIVRQPKLDVMASTKLAFLKTPTRMELNGDIHVDQANVGAIVETGSSVIELEVQEINGEGISGYDKTNTGSHIGPLLLNLNFEAPGKLFIRSYGLDSEWNASIKVLGSSQAPIVEGSASLVRGSYEFSGKIFKLSKGTLSFPGDRSNDPSLDITAEHQVPGLTAILSITGRASAPVLTMTSTPSLPPDEIFSRILFGTSVTELSAIEAIQLASTIRTLTTGGGPGLIGGVRRKLGIDRLSIGRSETEEQGPTITGGKYLTNNIYVEVTTAPATGETATAVEVAITPNLSVVTRRALGNDNNLAIRWSWDY